MDGHDAHKAGGDQRRVTRRAAIAAGAGIYAGGMLWAASSRAATRTPAQLLAELFQDVERSSVGRSLRLFLMTIIHRAETQLKQGNKAEARNTLQETLIPQLKRNAGHSGLTASQSKKWVADAENIVSKLSGLRAGVGGNVYVFNCFNEPISRLLVSGGSAGAIGAWSTGDRGAFKYTPAGLRVPRAKSETAGEFATGDNALSVSWDSFTGAATIKIPDPGSGVSFNDDLVLFVAVNQATLQSTRGFVLASFPVERT